MQIIHDTAVNSPTATVTAQDTSINLPATSGASCLSHTNSIATPAVIPAIREVPAGKRASGDTQSGYDEASRQDAKFAKLFSSGSISQLVVIELCAGSANLSAELRSLGFQVLPIDHKANIHKQKVRTILIDLSARGALQLVRNILDNANVIYCHMGPPCGTASAARNRPVDAILQAAGAPSPIPLRSKQFPLGFPWLTGLNRTKVLSANIIYSVCCEIAKMCLLRNIILSIENPLNSLFWVIPFIVALKADANLEFVVFQACMHGSTRNKWTAWLGTKGVFSSLAVVCDNNHKHDGWNLVKSGGKWKFDTAREAEYPRQLCSTVAHLVHAVAVSRGYLPLADDVQGEFSERQRRLWKRATTGKLPRGRSVPQVVSEFMSITELEGDLPTVPKDSRLLRRFWRKRDEAAPVSVSILGKWRTPEQFVKEACSVKHPYDSNLLVPDELKKALFNVLSLGPVGITKLRTQAVGQLAVLVKQLKDEDASYLQSMDPHNKNIMKNKRWALFERLLFETGFSDTHLVRDATAGFDVVGTAKKSGVLSPQMIPATMTPEELMTRSKWSAQSTLAKCNTSGNEALDKEIYNQTQEQLASKWIRGPFSLSEVSDLFPAGFAISRRFGIVQGSKTRLIDDCREPGINFALSTCEKLSLMDTDDMASLVKLIMESISENDKHFAFALGNGVTLRGKVHKDWFKDGRFLWKGKTTDLEAAYKNLCGSAATKWASVLAVFNPNSQKAELYVSDVLMFGSTAAVYGFNRVARGIWHIAVAKFNLLLTQFYDDFPEVEPALSCNGARIALQSLLKALGWKWASGTKDAPFDFAFPMLGNVFNVQNLDLGETIISNKPSRVEAITAEIKDVLRSKVMVPSRASELSGKLHYTESQVMGRAAVPAIRTIQDRANQRGGSNVLSDRMVYALNFMIDHLKSAVPRSIKVSNSDQPIVIFTDGSSEGDNHLWGMIAFFPGLVPQVAAGRVPAQLVTALKKANDQIITQVELYPVILAKVHFGSQLADKKVLWFIDNDGARDSLIAGTSASFPSMKLLSSFYKSQRLHASYNWFSRVASFSNPADAPSRGQFRESMLLFGAEQFHPKQLDQSELDEICRQ